MNPAERQIRAVHEEYCAFVGGDMYPVSVEFALCVAELHRQHKFRSACDIGSGFTSWLLRWLEPIIQIADTFEADDEWAKKSREFCGRPLNRGGWYHWLGSFQTRNFDGCYDLVIYDTAAAEGLPRDPEIPLVVSMVAPGGLLVVDDFNWPEYSGFVKGYFTALGWPWCALVESRDRHGRFAGLVGPRPV